MESERADRKGRERVRQRVYFAHGIQKYGTVEEGEVLVMLRAAFPGAEIINPGGSVEAAKGPYSERVKEFLLRNYCGKGCERVGACRIGHFLEMVSGADAFVYWLDGAKCGVEIERSFAKYLSTATFQVAGQRSGSYYLLEC